MDALAREYKDLIHFLFVYTREAHPGEVFPPHLSYEQKGQHALAFRRLGLNRPILVDAIDGKVHRLYGGVSNMSWVIDATGRVAYKASWTDAADIRQALKEVLKIHEAKRSGRRVSEFYRELMGVRLVDRPPDGMRYMGGKKAEEDVRRYRERAENERAET